MMREGGVGLTCDQTFVDRLTLGLILRGVCWAYGGIGPGDGCVGFWVYVWIRLGLIITRVRLVVIYHKDHKCNNPKLEVSDLQLSQSYHKGQTYQVLISQGSMLNIFQNKHPGTSSANLSKLRN